MDEESDEEHVIRQRVVRIKDEFRISGAADAAFEPELDEDGKPKVRSLQQTCLASMWRRYTAEGVPKLIGLGYYHGNYDLLQFPDIVRALALELKVSNSSTEPVERLRHLVEDIWSIFLELKIFSN